MRHGLLLLSLLCGLAWLGCNGQSGSPTSAQPPSQVTAQKAAPQPQPVAVPKDLSPDQVVTVFLNALRTGDSPTTESLLTGKAKTELAKHSLSVDVQSAPGATYQVQRAEILDGNPTGAHVKSVWTETFADGTSEPYEIVWVLRYQPEGWRLAGMAMQLLPNQAPQFLDFENPADMLKKKEEAIATMQALADAAQKAVPASSTAPVIER